LFNGHPPSIVISVFASSPTEAFQ